MLANNTSAQFLLLLRAFFRHLLNTQLREEGEKAWRNPIKKHDSGTKKAWKPKLRWLPLTTLSIGWRIATT